MNDSLVSVVLAVYNAERFVADSIQSVLNQTHKNIQLIIINDGSTDSTRSIIESFNDSRIELYNLTENRHISYATNVGFSHVRGDFVAIIDGDDIWEVNKLEKQLAYLKKHPEHKGCFTWVNLIDENGDIINDKFPDLCNIFKAHTDTQEEWLHFFFFYGNRLNNPSSLVAAETLKTIGGHNLFYIQATDMDWWVRFTKHYSFGIIEEPLTRYRRLVHSSESVSSLSEEHDARFYNEMVHIHYHFFDDMDDDLFIRSFQSDFIKADSRSPEELMCEKALLMLKPFNFNTNPCALGLLKIEALLSTPATAELMWSRYHFSTKECGTYTGQHLYNDLFLQKLPGELHKVYNTLHETQDYLNKKIKLQEELSATIQQQTVWLEQQNAWIEQQNTQIKQQHTQIEQQNTLISQQQQTLNQYEHRCTATEQKLYEVTETLHTITSSRIWKATTPIRKSLDLIKKLKK